MCEELWAVFVELPETVLGALSQPPPSKSRTTTGVALCQLCPLPAGTFSQQLSKEVSWGMMVSEPWEAPIVNSW